MSSILSHELLQLDGLEPRQHFFAMQLKPEWHDNVVLYDILCRLGFHQDHFEEGRSFSCEQTKFFDVKCHELPMLLSHAAVYELEEYWESKTNSLDPALILTPWRNPRPHIQDPSGYLTRGDIHHHYGNMWSYSVLYGANFAFGSDRLWEQGGIQTCRGIASTERNDAQEMRGKYGTRENVHKQGLVYNEVLRQVTPCMIPSYADILRRKDAQQMPESMFGVYKDYFINQSVMEYLGKSYMLSAMRLVLTVLQLDKEMQDNGNWRFHDREHHWSNEYSNCHPRAQGAYHHKPHYKYWSDKSYVPHEWVMKTLSQSHCMLDLQNSLIELGNKLLPATKPESETEACNPEPYDPTLLYCNECMCDLVNNPSHIGCAALEFNPRTSEFEPKMHPMQKLHDMFLTTSQAELYDVRHFTPGHRLLMHVVCTLMCDWTWHTPGPTCPTWADGEQKLFDQLKREADFYRSQRHPRYWPAPLTLGGFDGLRVFLPGVNFCLFPLPAHLYSDLHKDVRALTECCMDYPHYAQLNWYWSVEAKMPNASTSLIKDRFRMVYLNELIGPCDVGAPVNDPLYTHFNDARDGWFSKDNPHARLTHFEVAGAPPQLLNLRLKMTIQENRILNRAIRRHDQQMMDCGWKTFGDRHAIKLLELTEANICVQFERSGFDGYMGLYMHVPIDYERMLKMSSEPKWSKPEMADFCRCLYNNIGDEMTQSLYHMSEVYNHLMGVAQMRLPGFTVQGSHGAAVCHNLTFFACQGKSFKEFMEQTEALHELDKAVTLRPWQFDLILSYTEYLRKMHYHKADYNKLPLNNPINSLIMTQPWRKRLDLNKDMKTGIPWLAVVKRRKHLTSVALDAGPSVYVEDLPRSEGYSKSHCLWCTPNQHYPFKWGFERIDIGQGHQMGRHKRCHCVAEKFIKKSKKSKADGEEDMFIDPIEDAQGAWNLERD